MANAGRVRRDYTGTRNKSTVGPLTRICAFFRGLIALAIDSVFLQPWRGLRLSGTSGNYWNYGIVAEAARMALAVERAGAILSTRTANNGSVPVKPRTCVGRQNGQ